VGLPLPANPLAPYNSMRGSKHTNMACDGKRLYVSGGDWQHSATDGTWSYSLEDASCRQDVPSPIYPTLPAPHALQDNAGFAWVAEKQKFLLWPGSYYPYEADGTPILEYAKGMWWLDPATNTYEQDLRLFGKRFDTTGCPFGGVYDNGLIIAFVDSSGGMAVRRWDVVARVKLPDLPLTLSVPAHWAAYFMRTQYQKIGRWVYVLGYRTDGNVSSQQPLLFRWHLDTHTTEELAPPPVDGPSMRDLEIRTAQSDGKLVWPVVFGPDGEIHGIAVYDGGWTIDAQVPAYGNFICNAVCSLPDGRVAMCGGEFGRQQTHLWLYRAA